MKSYLHFILILGLVFFSACSGNSPTPSAVPTAATDTWTVTLDLSSTQPLVNQVIVATATVQRNGSAAPDGTTVEFLSTVGGVFVNGTTQAQVTTSGGRAAIQYAAAEAGAYTIQARAHAQTAQRTVNYRNPNTPDTLQIISVTPGSGSLDGGEQVTISALGISTPVEVYFDVTQQGTAVGSFQAAIISVNTGLSAATTETSASAAVGSITLLTPQITGADTALEGLADVRVIAGVGTGGQEEAVSAGSFRFLPTTSDPEIYVLVPSFGSSGGGEQVSILGRNFLAPVQVTFGGLAANEIVLAGDGTQIAVMTPQYSATPLTVDTPVDVVVISEAGTSREKTATKTSGFVFEADTPTPVITAISPTAGPLDGGTRVTIFGSGFDFPAQVFFGELEALVINVEKSQIIVETPDYSAVTETEPPIVVDVRVVNVESGLSATLSGSFTYGENLFISGNTPVRGDFGELVTIYGSGFTDPLQVFFAIDGGEQVVVLDVIAVSGNQIVVRIPEWTAYCETFDGLFRVRLLDSNVEAEGGVFKLFGNNPILISVNPLTYQSLSDGDAVTPSTATLFGQRFLDGATVSFSGPLAPQYVLPSGDIEFVDETTINVLNVPAPNDFGLQWQTAQCVTDLGLTGVRDIATPVDVSVTNYPGGCTSTLPSAVVFEPENSDCVVAPLLSVTLPTLPDADSSGVLAPYPSTEILTVSNNGAGTLDVSAMNLVGQFYFDNACSQQASGAFTVAPFDADTRNVYFCPNQDDARTYTGALTVISNDASSPWQGTPTGTEVSPLITVSPTALNFVGANDQQTATITNAFGAQIGTSPLNWSAVITGANSAEFSFVTASNGTVLPLALFDLILEYTGNNAPASATLEITHDAQDTVLMPNPIIVTLTGN
ncbi:MAG: hypothetical protein GY906_17395 [bacterium]|nr:hypothetical protein [bacterium]